MNGGCRWADNRWFDADLYRKRDAGDCVASAIIDADADAGRTPASDFSTPTHLLTSAVLRLECSLDCVSGSVGHQHHSYRLLYHSQRFL